MPENIWILLVKKLTKEASTPDLRELELYFDENPDAKRMEEELLQFWNASVDDQADNHKLFANHLRRLKASNPGFALNEEWQNEPAKGNIVTNAAKIELWRYLSVAAVLILISVSVIWAIGHDFGRKAEYVEAPKPIINEIQTRAGSRSKVVLPDGSEVWVNASSRLLYNPDFGKTHRKVQLNGEAYFQVAKNKALPFEIETRSITITVTGTTFNVRAYDDEEKAETSLFEGSVMVIQNKSPDKNYTLQPNQKLIFDESKENNTNISQQSSKIRPITQFETISTAEPIVKDITYDYRDSMALETSWLYSTLAFRDESFLELSYKLEKWYGMEIAFESKRLEKIRFTGRFTTETMQEALEALQFTAHFKFRKEENRVTIY